jgi:hypothetical protein
MTATVIFGVASLLVFVIIGALKTGKSLFD